MNAIETARQTAEKAIQTAEKARGVATEKANKATAAKGKKHEPQAIGAWTAAEDAAVAAETARDVAIKALADLEAPVENKPTPAPEDKPTPAPAPVKASKAAPRTTVNVTDAKGNVHTYTGPVRKGASGETVINGHDEYRRKYAERIAGMTEQAVMAEKVDRMATRCASLADDTAHWIDVVTASGPIALATLAPTLARVGRDLAAVKAMLGTLPSDWKAPEAPSAPGSSGPKGKGKIEAGAVARFTSKAAPDYSDDAGADDDLTIVKVAGNRARVQVGTRPAFWAATADLRITIPAPVAPVAPAPGAAPTA